MSVWLALLAWCGASVLVGALWAALRTIEKHYIARLQSRRRRRS
jgi:hypothetical protein